MNRFILALPLILLAGAALATPYTIDRGDGVHIPNPDCDERCHADGDPKPAPAPVTHKADRSEPVSLHQPAPKQQVPYICKRTGLRYPTKAEALRACKPLVKRKTVRVRKAKVCK